MSAKVGIDRRDFLKLSSLGDFTPAIAQSVSPAESKADYTLRIATGLVELAPEHIVSTTLYNGQFPGPLLRFKVDFIADNPGPTLFHCHQQLHMDFGFMALIRYA
jgi:FtsP/CotA-like multicopper oxidase with cupredoxin domain